MQVKAPDTKGKKIIPLHRHDDELVQLPNDLVEDKDNKGSNSVLTHLRTMASGAYDIQKLRISTGNRIVSNFRAQKGENLQEKRTEKNQEKEDKMLKDMVNDYKLLTDGLAVKTSDEMIAKDFKGTKLISDFSMYCLVRTYAELLDNEEQQMKRLGFWLDRVPVYVNFLKPIKGIGNTLGAVLLAYFDIHKAKYASSLWAYVGLDVAPDGKGRSSRKEHLIDVEYVDKDGKNAVKKGITHNRFLKSKLIGVMAPCFIKAIGTGNTYAHIYYEYKNRLLNRPSHISPFYKESKPKKHNYAKDSKEGKYFREALGDKFKEGVKYKKCPYLKALGYPEKDYTVPDLDHYNVDGKIINGHLHNMAMRYMVKIFLIDFYVAWRKEEGLTVYPPYHEAKLGLTHGR